MAINGFRLGFVRFAAFLLTASSESRATLNAAWTDTLAHAPTLLLTWLCAIAVYGFTVLIGLVISLVFTAADDGTGSAEMLGLVLSNFAQLPFVIVQNLIGVMFTAIPAVFYSRSEVVSFSDAYAILMGRLGRYVLAGVLYSVVAGVGFVLCVLPGIAVVTVLPIYVNKVFTTDDDVMTCFTSSFSAAFGSQKGWGFVGIQALAILLAIVTCGFCLVGLIVYVPVITFFLQKYIVVNGLVRQSAA